MTPLIFSTETFPRSELADVILQHTLLTTFFLQGRPAALLTHTQHACMNHTKYTRTGHTHKPEGLVASVQNINTVSC